MDSSIIDANIEQLEANLSAAEAVFKASESKYAREKRLHAQNFISISTLENTEKLFLESKSRLALAQAELKREKRNKTFTNITSPISGVVMEKKIDVGQTVAARFQTPTLFKIAADLNSMQIEALVSEADIGQVKRGQRVKFFVDAFFEELFEGTVELIRLEPKVEQGVVNYIVVINVDNEEKKLLPGMTAQATIITSSKEGTFGSTSCRYDLNHQIMFLSRKKNIAEKNIFCRKSYPLYSVNGNRSTFWSIKSKQEFQMEDLLRLLEGFEIGNEVITGEVNKKKEKVPHFDLVDVKMIPLISVAELYKEYSENLPEPVKVLKNLNLEIFRGEFVSLMGPSGSGKSTLLNMLGLLDSPTSGTISFEERGISKLTSLEKARLRNSSFGFIFQGFNLLKKHSVLENVMLPLALFEGSKRKSCSSAKEILDATGLGSLSDRLPSQLSGGQQQRVAICRALVVKPTVILADEPTGNLDSTTASKLCKY